MWTPSLGAPHRRYRDRSLLIFHEGVFIDLSAGPPPLKPASSVGNKILQPLAALGSWITQIVLQFWLSQSTLYPQMRTSLAWGSFNIQGSAIKEREQAAPLTGRGLFGAAPVSNRGAASLTRVWCLYISPSWDSPTDPKTPLCYFQEKEWLMFQSQNIPWDSTFFWLTTECKCLVSFTLWLCQNHSPFPCLSRHKR